MSPLRFSAPRIQLPSASARARAHARRGLRALGQGQLALGLFAAGATGCSNDEETRTLEPVVLAMSEQVAPTSVGPELQICEVKRSVLLPVRRPSQDTQRSLNGSAVEPFPAGVWVRMEDVAVQVSWVLTNLDREDHNVELLLDAHNEFGRYWPGYQLVDPEEGELAPNLSGSDEYFVLPGTDAGEASRRRGTWTFDDMEELAIDFATAINIIENVPPPPPDAEGEDNPATFVNHALHWQNRSYDTPLTRRFIPSVIPGLTGFDVGLRADGREEGDTIVCPNLAVEVVVEIVEKGQDKDFVLDDGESMELAYPEPTVYWTLSAI